MCSASASPFQTLLELDMSDAYLAHFLELPTGTSYWFQDGHVSPFITYFAECEIRIHHKLPLGPFPRRVGRKESRIVYPTLPEKYKAYLWKEQIQDCKDAGCSVRVGHGVGWKYLTNDTTAYARYMHTSRLALAGTPIERDCKKTAVSGLGHFGMKHDFYRLVSEDNGKDPCLINSIAQPLKFYVREYSDYQRPAMIHWYNYLIMQCARSLYKYALPYAVDGRLIMTNYDALLVIEKDERARFARKHSLDAMMCEMGDLRWQELTNVKILGERSLKCDQKVITP